jgi:hypothetical protein
MSANGRPHCVSPAITIALPALLAEAATRSCSWLANIIFANTFAHALITPVHTMTEQLVAALSSGLRIVPLGITKLNGANVALEIGRS